MGRLCMGRLGFELGNAPQELGKFQQSAGPSWAVAMSEVLGGSTSHQVLRCLGLGLILRCSEVFSWLSGWVSHLTHQ